jgi:hypothetical protein
LRAAVAVPVEVVARIQGVAGEGCGRGRGLLTGTTLKEEDTWACIWLLCVLQNRQ